MSTDQQLGWLRNLSKAQLSEATLAVVQIQKEVNALATRVNGEHELRSLGWERRLALAKREWQDDLEAMRTECSIMLKEADELVALQREEAELYREEALLRVAQRDAAEQKVLMLQGSQRRLVLRARGALRRAEEAEAEAAEATAAADRASASNEAARRRAEAEREVLVAALAIGEGEDGYLERIAHDQSLPVAQRESAMLRAKLQDLREMAAKHAVDAGAVAHAMAEVELREARAERRAQALEQRLHACEGELGARRMAELQAARRAMVVRKPVDGGGEVSGMLTLWSAGGSQGEAKGAGALQAKGEGAFDADESGRGASGVGPSRWQISLAERCALAEEMVEARNAELEASRVELAAATEERRLIGEGAAARSSALRAR